MFWISCCLLYVRAGSRGLAKSNHCEEKGRRVRLSGISLCLKRLVSSQIIAGGDAECRVRRRFRGHAHHGLCGDNDQIDKPARCLHRASSVRINWLFLGDRRLCRLPDSHLALVTTVNCTMAADPLISWDYANEHCRRQSTSVKAS